MKKRNIFIAVLVVILIVAAVLIWVSRGSGRVSDNGDGEVVPEDLTIEDVQAGIEKCEKEKEYFQAECFQNLAAAAKDPALCDRVPEVWEISFETSGVFISKGTCLAYVASELDYDFSVCDEVKDLSEEYQLCNDMVTMDYVWETKELSHCEGILGDDYWYANCVSGGVESEEDVDYCEKVAGGDPRTVCYDQAYKNLAIALEDISLCDKSNRMVFSKSTCIAEYAQKYEDLSLCDVLDSDENICICYNMFFSEVSNEVCSELDDEMQSANCFNCLEMDLYK